MCDTCEKDIVEEKPFVRNEKHDSEAAESGATILGWGTNGGNRLYRLECGHEQVVSVSCLRDNTYHCKECKRLQFEREAEEAGVELVSDVKKASYKLFRFKGCGHKQELSLLHVRNKTINCKQCEEDKFIKEAEEQGCVLIGSVGKKAYRKYLLPCNHTAIIRLDGVRAGSFRCQTCLEEKHKRSAEERGCALLGASDKGCDYRQYRLKCNCVMDLLISSVKNGKFHCKNCDVKSKKEKVINPNSVRFWCVHDGKKQPECKECRDKRYHEEAVRRGCELLGESTRGCDYRTYRLPCNHIESINVWSMRHDAVTCKQCIEEERIRNAEKQGCTYLKVPVIAKGMGAFRMSCGHFSVFGFSKVRDGRIKCRVCGGSHWTNPSLFYVIKLTRSVEGKSFSWIKNGVTGDLKYRIYGYRLDDYTAYEIIHTTKKFPTRYLSVEFEKSVEDFNISYKYDKEDFRSIMKNGFDECYSIEALDRTLEFVKEFEANNDYAVKE